MRTITFRQPADMHVHFRDGALLRTVVPYTSRAVNAAIVMPNLDPPIRDAVSAASYRERIMEAVPDGCDFTPLMTCYLTDDTDPGDLVRGHAEGIFTAAKLYPANATTNSAYGVSDIWRLDGVLAAMEAASLPLLTHGEVVGSDVDIFDRERRFLEDVLEPMLRRFPGLRVVMEHVTTKEAVAFVRAHPEQMAATITPQHLLYSRNALFAGGLRPHMFCLPILKREEHRLALRAAATSGDAQFFLGTDTAPHLRHLKEAACGCAGVFSAPVAIEAYLEVFAQEGALDRFEAFASLNGPAFYRRAPSQKCVTYVERPRTVMGTLDVPGEGALVPLFAGGCTSWSLDNPCPDGDYGS
jgi:dihydroorotase